MKRNPLFDSKIYYFKSSQPAAALEAVRGESRIQELRSASEDIRHQGATPFQDELKEFEVKAPTVGIFGETSKDGESVLKIVAWKHADEHCTFFASEPQVALLSRIQIVRKSGSEPRRDRTQSDGCNCFFPNKMVSLMVFKQFRCQLTPRNLNINAFYCFSIAFHEYWISQFVAFHNRLNL